MGLGVGPITFGSVRVEIRWKDSGSKKRVKNPDGTETVYKSNTFTFETRGGGVDASAGAPFNNASGLVALFNPAVTTESMIRNIVRQMLAEDQGNK